MLETKNKYSDYEFLNSNQLEITPKVEALLIGLTVREASELLHTVRKAIENTKIS